jgi:hypothetical protein
MTNSERIKLLEETVLLMSKCLDVQRFLKLSERQQNLLMTNIADISLDLGKAEPDTDYTLPKFDIYISASPNEHGRCYECPHKTDTCQEGCIV